MWYVIVGEDVQDSLGTRLATRPAHVQRLEALKTQGRLLLAGPFPPSTRPIRDPPATPAASSSPNSTHWTRPSSGPMRTLTWRAASMPASPSGRSKRPCHER